MTSLQNAQKLAHSVKVLDKVANNVRRRAVEALRSGKIDYSEYEEIDGKCDEVNAGARRLDKLVLELALDGLDEPMAQLDRATAKLDQACKRIATVNKVVVLAGVMLLAGLAVAAMAADPTKVTALAAAKAITDVVLTIDAVAVAEPD